MSKWEELLEAYTGHSVTRGHIKSFGEIDKDITEVHDFLDTLYHELGSKKTKIDLVENALRNLRTKIVKNTVPQTNITKIDKALHHIQLFYRLIADGRKTLDEAKDELGEAWAFADDAKEDFIKLAKQGIFKP